MFQMLKIAGTPPVFEMKSDLIKPRSLQERSAFERYTRVPLKAASLRPQKAPTHQPTNQPTNQPTIQLSK